MGRRGGSVPAQPGGSEFHRPKRAWLRTGRTDGYLDANTGVSDQYCDYGFPSRKRHGAKAGSVLTLLIDEHQLVVRFCQKGERARAAEGDSVGVVCGNVAASLRGRFPGEEVWLSTGAGLPKPYGRRVKVKVLEVTPASDSSRNSRGVL